MSDSPVIAFVSGEGLTTRLRREWVQQHPGASGDEILAAVERIERESVRGEYREVTDFGPDGARHVWVDENPDDHTDPAGRFEAYDIASHGEPYHPTPSLRGQEPLVIAKEGGASLAPTASGDQA